MQKLVLPANLLGGTPRGELAELLDNARSAVAAVIRAVEDASPNGRDYYPQGAAAHRTAIAEWVAIKELLRSLNQELLVLGDAEYSDDRSVDLQSAMKSVLSSPSVTPTVHLNGTSQAELVDLPKAVFSKAQTALESLRRTLPNLRDYTNIDEWEKAKSQHADREKVLKIVGEYFLNLARAAKSQRAA